MSSAQLLAVHEVLDRTIDEETSQQATNIAAQAAAWVVPAITQRHLMDAFQSSSVSVPDKERRRFEQIYARFVRSRQDQPVAFDRDAKQRVISA
jgi:hypothetical protein